MIKNHYIDAQPYAEPVAGWPDDGVFISMADKPQFTDGRARCTRVAVLNGKGESTRTFRQGEQAHFHFEFVLAEDLEVPAGGVDLKHESGVVAHGKSSFQTPQLLPESVPAGAAIRVHQWIGLDLMPGRYDVSLGLAGASAPAYGGYSIGRLSHQEFQTREHCRVPDAVSIEVQWADSGSLRHHGIANLPGGIGLDVRQGAQAHGAVCPADPKPADDWPTLLHVTHWKAGSQWINKILRACAPGRIVSAEPDEAQVRNFAIQPGRVYPTVYLSKTELDKIVLPPDTAKFVVIRDLRDTLVSGYWSFRHSHPIQVRHNLTVRETLSRLDFEDGMLYLMERFIANCAAIQLSWIESTEVVLKYEDLLENDVALLEDVLLRKCRAPLDPATLRNAILANRFEALTSGRRRGEEDRSAHERKGVAGDWRNYFTERLKTAFKARFGGLLVACGYEKDLDW
jgi:hypothetical protein